MVSNNINVQVIYPLPSEQITFTVSVEQGSNAQQAIEASGILVKYPEIELKKNKLGVYSRLIKLDTVVEDGERIEIYRPLIADPKEMRKRRADQAKQDGRLHEKTGQKIR